MKSDAKEIMAEVVVSVMETMAFMFVEVVKRDEILEVEDTYLHAQINFTGHSSGELGLVLSSELASNIAANVLGIEPGDSTEDAMEDMAEEVLNVVCGQFLTLMFGDKPIFELSVPHVSVLGSSVCKELLSSPDVVAFMVEDSPVLGYVRLGEEGK